MTIKDGAFRRQAAKLTAILLVLVVYGFARVPEASESELAKLAEGFRFSAAPLPTMSGETPEDNPRRQPIVAPHCRLDLQCWGSGGAERPRR